VEMVYCVSMTMAKYSVYIGFAWAWRTLLVMTATADKPVMGPGRAPLLPVTLPATFISFCSTFVLSYGVIVSMRK